MQINQDYVLGAYETAVFRVLGDSTILACWVESTTDAWAAPYTIKKAVSTDGGEHWNTTTILSPVPFQTDEWNNQHLAIDPAGVIYYTAGGPRTGSPEGLSETSLHIGKYDGSWTWTELDQHPSYGTYCMRFDGNNTPYMLTSGPAPEYDAYILHFDGDAWVDDNADVKTWYMFVSADGTIHTVYQTPTGHTNEWDMYDQWNDYYTKKINGVWSDPLHIPQIPLTGNLSDMVVDAYNNVHMIYCLYNEDWQMTNYYLKITPDDVISDPFTIGDGAAWSETAATIGCFFPNQKIYFTFFDMDDGWVYTRARLRVLDTLTNTWDDISDVLNVREGYSFYAGEPMLHGSHYNGWGVLLVSFRIAPPQIQSLDVLWGDEEPTTFNPKQMFEMEGQKTNTKNGICEQNVDCMTCASYWRVDGYPEIMTDDMEQVAIFRSKQTGQHNEVPVYSFYVGNDNSGDFPPDQYDFIGLFWRNSLIQLPE